jgi:hypothetical protein
VVAERHRRGAPHPAGRLARDLPQQAEDLPVVQRVAGDGAGAPVGQQGGGLPHGELEGIGALLVHDLNEAIESGHGDLSRGDG